MAEAGEGAAGGAEGGFVPALWRHLEPATPQPAVSHGAEKERFWRRPERLRRAAERTWLDVSPDRLSEGIVSRSSSTTGGILPMRAGHPETEYRAGLEAALEERTPQYNLRNVPRLHREGDPSWLEWGRTELPSRTGFAADLEEVRTARHERPEFQDEQYASTTSAALRKELVRVFYENDWEQWYGDARKREAGGLWRYFPPDGGRRTRPWPEIRLVPHLYWKGRLITDE